MFSKLRGLAVTLAVCALLAASAPPASASALAGHGSEAERSVNVVFDAFVLRPIGLIVTITGTVAYGAVVAPLVAITRPTDIGKPLEPLVLRPARYTFIDPLGKH